MSPPSLEIANGRFFSVKGQQVRRWAESSSMFSREQELSQALLPPRHWKKWKAWARILSGLALVLARRKLQIIYEPHGQLGTRTVITLGKRQIVHRKVMTLGRMWSQKLDPVSCGARQHYLGTGTLRSGTKTRCETTGQIPLGTLTMPLGDGVYFQAQSCSLQRTHRWDWSLQGHLLCR